MANEVNILNYNPNNSAIDSILKLESHFQEMAKVQKKILNSIDSQQILKFVENINNQSIKYQAVFKEISDRIQQLNQINLPKTMSSLELISSQYENLRKNLHSSFVGLNINPHTLAQINNLQFVIKDLQKSILTSTIYQNNETSINDIEELSTETVYFHEKILNSDYITHKELLEFQKSIERIDSKIDKIDTDINNKLMKWFAIISFILSIISEGRNWVSKPEYATKNEIDSIVERRLKIFEEKIKNNHKVRLTKIRCNVRLKPQSNSHVIESLPSDYDVIVMEGNHKWVLISFKSQFDQSNKMGWVQKKHLEIP